MGPGSAFASLTGPGRHSYLRRIACYFFKTGPPMRDRLEDKAFLILIVAVSLAFAWILTSFYGAILWGVVIAMMFAPLYRRLLRKMPERPTVASVIMLVAIVLIVILPLTLIAAALTQQGAVVVGKMQS